VQRTPSGARQTVELKKELAFVVHVRSRGLLAVLCMLIVAQRMRAFL
jgi:hypothetical protein